VSESQILKAVGQLLGLHPKVAYCWRHNNGAFHAEHRFIRFGHEGVSDFVGFTKRGQFLAIECKSARGRLTKSQETFLLRVKEAGGVCGVARSVFDAQQILESA
jgi:hypothetical protein